MYEQFYGLTGRPFQLTPDPDFYFESASHKKALSYLGYGLSQGEGFIVITGEVGAGKSTLVGHLMEKVDPDQLTVGKVVTSALDGEEMIHVVAQSFGLEVEGRDKAAALGAIEWFLQEEAREGRRCLLIVDESQNLDIDALEELRMLSNFQMGSHPLLQTLLLGQPEFRQTVVGHPELEQLRQRVIASHHLDALEANEVEAYVRHRFEMVGWDGNPEITNEVFAELYDATDGIPRRINQVMNRLLLLGAIEERAGFTVKMLDDVCAEMMVDAEQGATNAAPASAENVAPIAAAMGAEVGAELAQRDAKIAELEKAIGTMRDASQSQVAPLTDDQNLKLAELERRLDDQEQSVRHVLTLLVEWFAIVC